MALNFPRAALAARISEKSRQRGNAAVSIASETSHEPVPRPPPSPAPRSGATRDATRRRKCACRSIIATVDTGYRAIFFVCPTNSPIKMRPADARLMPPATLAARRSRKIRSMPRGNNHPGRTNYTEIHGISSSYSFRYRIFAEHARVLTRSIPVAFPFTLSFLFAVPMRNPRGRVRFRITYLSTNSRLFDGRRLYRLFRICNGINKYRGPASFAFEARRRR